MVMYGNTIRLLGKAMSAADFYPSDIVLATIQCLGMSDVSHMNTHVSVVT